MTTLEGLLKMNENGTRKVFQVPGKGVWFKCTFKALHQIKKWGEGVVGLSGIFLLVSDFCPSLYQALMLENLQKHSTPHAAFQPNSQVREEAW